MSHSISNNSDSLEDWDKLKRVAFQVLRPTSFDALENWSIEDITEAVYEQYYGAKYPQIERIRSEVNIDLTENVVLETGKKEAPTDIWVFGYGSLIWKVDFPYIDRKAGYIKGYERMFYQNSIDHRGVPEKPGRVVTLIPSSQLSSKVWGVGYRISCKVKNSVVQNLDVREKNGYNRLPVLFYEYSDLSEEDSEPIEMAAYVAAEDNDSFAGHVNNLDDIAQQIFEASGPSGTNREYVYKLANAMRKLFPDQEDEHLFNLEAKLRMKETEYIELIDQVKENIKQVLRTGILVGRPIGDIRFQLKNLDPNN